MAVLLNQDAAVTPSAGCAADLPAGEYDGLYVDIHKADPNKVYVRIAAIAPASKTSKGGAA